MKIALTDIAIFIAAMALALGHYVSGNVETIYQPLMTFTAVLFACGLIAELRFLNRLWRNGERGYLPRQFECALGIVLISTAIGSCFLDGSRENLWLGKLLWSEIGLMLSAMILAIPHTPRSQSAERKRSWTDLLCGSALIYLLHHVVFEQGILVVYLVNLAIEAIEAFQPFSQYSIGSGSLYEGLEPFAPRRLDPLIRSSAHGVLWLIAAVVCYFNAVRQTPERKRNAASIAVLIVSLLATLYWLNHLVQDVLPTFSPPMMQSYEYVPRRVWWHFLLLAAFGATWMARSLGDHSLDIARQHTYHRQRWLLIAPIVIWGTQFARSLVHADFNGRIHLWWDEVAYLLLSRSLLSSILAASCTLLLVRSVKDRRQLMLQRDSLVQPNQYALLIVLGTILLCCLAPILIAIEIAIVHLGLNR